MKLCSVSTTSFYATFQVQHSKECNSDVINGRRYSSIILHRRLQLAVVCQLLGAAPGSRFDGCVSFLLYHVNGYYTEPCARKRDEDEDEKKCRLRSSRMWVVDMAHMAICLGAEGFDMAGEDDHPVKNRKTAALNVDDGGLHLCEKGAVCVWKFSAFFDKF